MGPAGQPVNAVDDYPVHRSYPTAFWQEGDQVVDVYDLVSQVQPVAGWQILVILYDAATVEEVGRIVLPI